MRNESWANYIKEKRKLKKLTRRQLAILTKVDPSYLTLIERDGYVPRRDKVLGFASVLDIDPGEMLLMAGYAPYIDSSSENNDAFINSKLFNQELFSIVKFLSELDAKEQLRALEVVRTCLSAVGFNLPV